MKTELPSLYENNGYYSTQRDVILQVCAKHIPGLYFTNVLGVLREFNLESQRPRDQQWIREVVVDEDKYFIVCCTYAQATRFLSQKFAEIDLAYKMIQGKPTVFSIVGFDERVQRTYCICLSYVTCSPSLGTERYVYSISNAVRSHLYNTLFPLIFRILGEVGGSPVKWHHIHSGAGLYAITIDMDSTQAQGILDVCQPYGNITLILYIGLGTYLDAVSGFEWGWEKHLEHVLIFCQVHVERNFRKKFQQHKAFSILNQLWEAETYEEYVERIQSLCRQYPDLRSWLRGKQKGWIASGLVRRLSKIPGTYWGYARKNTNIAEVTHAEDNNATGRGLTVLGAVIA